MKSRKFSLGLDRFIYGGSLWQILILFGITLSVFFIVGGLIVLIWGESIGIAEGLDKEYPLWQLYYYFADPGNQMSMSEPSGSGRVIGLVMSTLGSILLGGLLISTISNIIERRVDECRIGHNYYKFSDHVVIIGSDQMIFGLVKQALATGAKRVVILTSKGVEELRQEIYASLPTKKQRKKVIVNYGVRDSEDYLSKINVTQAREVYVVGDESEFDEIESYHDSLNVECLKHIAALCKKDGRRGLPCKVSFNYKTTYHVFQYADLSTEVTDYIQFHPFNFDEFWARKVLVAGVSPDSNIRYKPLDYRPITSQESDDYVHLIVIGLSHMGQAMALQAAHVAHFPNYRRRKTRITIIDRNMRHEMDEFKQKCGALFEVSKSTYIDADIWEETGVQYVRSYGIDENEYHHLITDADDKNFIDIEWTFIKGDDSNTKVRQLLRQYAADSHAIVTVAVCLNITHCSLRSAMFLPKIYYEKNVPILVQQRKTETLVDTLNGKDLPDKTRDVLRYKNLLPFGMVYDCYDISLINSVRLCKRINAVYSLYSGVETMPERIDDAKADELWSMRQTSKRWSNIFAAASIPTKLRCLGYDTEAISSGTLQVQPLSEEQVMMLAEMEHNRWNVEELLLGYRPVTREEDAAIDTDKKLKNKYKASYIHYDIRPYAGLKDDAHGNKASVYDELIVRYLPLIVR